ncbi:hypothetical protein PO909_031825 [Leuciscus waleckii]
MYGMEDVTDLSVHERKKRREANLDANPDVLFRVYSPVYPPDDEKLCALVFRPTADPIRWMTLLNRYRNITTQWTHKQLTALPRNVIKISRRGDEINTICVEFPNHLEEINDPANDIEDLGAGIQ